MQSRMRLFLLIGSLLFCLTGCRHITITDVICTTEPEEPEYTVIAMLSDTIVQTQHTVKQVQKNYAEQAAKKEQERKQQEAKRQKELQKQQEAKRQKEAQQKQAAKMETPTIPKSVSLSGPAINDGVDASWVAAVNQELAKAPANVLQAFKNSGWSFHVTPINIDAVYFGGQYGSVMGVTVYEENAIYLEDRWDAVQEAVLHELGHFVDSYLGYPSDTLSIYDAEAASYCSYFGVDFYWDRMEFYADSFWKYVTIPDDLKVCAPQMYGYWTETLPVII